MSRTPDPSTEDFRPEIAFGDLTHAERRAVVGRARTKAAASRRGGRSYIFKSMNFLVWEPETGRSIRLLPEQSEVAGQLFRYPSAKIPQHESARSPLPAAFRNLLRRLQRRSAALLRVLRRAPE